MIDLKVSKGIYLIWAIFFCIIKYQSFREQHKIFGYEEYFSNYKIYQKEIIKFAINQKIWFLKEKRKFMKNKPLSKECKCPHCQQTLDQIYSSSLYWKKINLSEN